MTTATRHGTTPAAITAPDWPRALCAQTDPALFFPDGTGGKVKRDKDQAKKVCGRCPIRAACGQWALDTGQHAGVWGGMDEDERRTLARVREPGIVRCFNAQAWIEAELAKGQTQAAVARELDVDEGALSRAVRKFAAERQSAGEAVKTA